LHAHLVKSAHYTWCKKARFHRAFLIRAFDAACNAAMCRCKVLMRDVWRALLRQDAPNVRRIHTSLSRTLFFSLCCSKRNSSARRFPTALMRHRHDFHG
jgi:hypothetical protein